MELVQSWVEAGSELVIVMVDAMAVVAVMVGSIQAFVAGLRSVSPAADSQRHVRQVWMRYARWLVAALTFQLAADILETAISPSVEATLQLGAIALIRTLLSFFLERDLREFGTEDAPSRTAVGCSEAES